MKKLICLFAFIGLGYLAVNAQNAPAPAAATPAPSTSVQPAADAPKDDKAPEVKAENKVKKKECSSAEKQNCSSAHSCCRKKAEVKKEVKVVTP